jgi:hypothetical protein
LKGGNSLFLVAMVAFVELIFGLFFSDNVLRICTMGSLGEFGIIELSGGVIYWEFKRKLWDVLETKKVMCGGIVISRQLCTQKVMFGRSCLVS